jgi:uncharacterized protein HemY
MLPIALVAWVAVLAHSVVAFVVVMAVIYGVMLLVDRTCMSPFDHMIRERRRHARRTARAMRRMSEIRRQTTERMDRAEERRWS